MTPVPRRRYNDAYDALRRLRFYLLPEDCQRLNAAVEDIEKRLREEDPEGVQIIRNKFEPAEVMDPGFYYEPD